MGVVIYMINILTMVKSSLIVILPVPIAYEGVVVYMINIRYLEKSSRIIMLTVP